MTEGARNVAVLFALGMGWGMTQPLGKIATTTGHGPFGLIFWQLVVCVPVLGGLWLLRGKGLVLTRPALGFAVVVAVLGTLVPNATFYTSVERLPPGIMSILISAVPMLSFPIALALGMGRFSALRLAGLSMGLAGLALIALPGAGLHAAGVSAFIPLALVGPFFYAIETNYVARFGTAGMEAVQAMFMASLVGLGICLPVALATGQMFTRSRPLAARKRRWSSPVWCMACAMRAMSGRQRVPVRCLPRTVPILSPCLVSVAGVFWAMMLLGARLPPQVWVSLVFMLAGVALVSPRGSDRADAV